MQRDWLAALMQLLDEQIAAAVELVEGLQAERQALTGRSVEALNASSANKERLLARFEELEQERRMLCGAAGAGNDARAMDKLLGAQETGVRATLEAKWRRVRELTARCRDANETNGMIAQARQRQILQLLGLMRTGANAGATYGRTGVAATSASSRALASA
jgi:flagellar biosynthesis protein FlgN